MRKKYEVGSTQAGRIKMVDYIRGFGFIEQVGFEDIFFHVDGCKVEFTTLEQGDDVSFRVSENQRHPDKTQANNVMRV